MKRPEAPVFRVLRTPNLLTCLRATAVVRRGESPQSLQTFEIVVTRRRWNYCRDFKRVKTVTLTGHLGGFQRIGCAKDKSNLYCYTLYFECSDSSYKALKLPSKKFAVVITDFDGNVAIKGYIDQNDPHSQPA